MSLIGLLIAILVIGLIVYLVRMLDIPAPFKNAVIAVVIVICIIWLLGGLTGHHFFIR